MRLSIFSVKIQKKDEAFYGIQSNGKVNVCSFIIPVKVSNSNLDQMIINILFSLTANSLSLSSLKTESLTVSSIKTYINFILFYCILNILKINAYTIIYVLFQIDIFKTKCVLWNFTQFFSYKITVIERFYFSSFFVMIKHILYFSTIIKGGYYSRA